MSAELQHVLAQIEQIEQAHRQGTLSDELYAQARQRLDAALMAALEAAPRAPLPEAPPRAPQPRGRLPRRGLALAAAVLVLGCAGYAWKGSPRLGSGTPAGWGGPAGPQAAASAPHALGNEAMAAMVSTLADKLKAQPDDAAGWAMLARSYTTLGQVADALPAYAQALKRAPQDAELMADYADALALQAGRQLGGEPMAWVKKALAQDPRQPKALLLAGTEAFNRQDLATAIKYWEQVVASGPADSALVEQARNGLDDARKLQGGQAPGLLPGVVTAQSTGASPAAAGARVGGTVRLAAELASDARPDDTVFVFARAAEGPRMPLALIQRRVRDLPLKFQLDDSMAMNPAARLSGAARVVLTARVSRSGQAQPQPGDLEGASQAVALGRGDVDLVIATRLR